METEGFEMEENSFVVPRNGLWEGFHRLRSRWATPDPLTIWVDAAMSGSKVELDEITQISRTLKNVPSDSEVREALEEQLRPRSLYRVRWRG